MNFLDTHVLLISTLSPVHIGCGEDYEPTNYVIDDKGVLHVLEASALARAGGESLVVDITKALEKDETTTQLRAVHAALQRHRDKLVPVGITHVPLCKGVLAHYRQTQDARNDFNRNGIERTAFNPSDQCPYLPGSSIKGAMRTAWLCKRGTGRTPFNRALTERIAQFNRMIEEVELGNGKSTWKLKDNHSKRDYEIERKGIEKDLQRAAENIESGWLGGNFETDPLRALKVGDARTLDQEEVERDIRFCLNRSRSGRKTQAQSKNLYTRLEYIGEHQPATFGLQLSLHRLEAIAGRRNAKGQPIAPENDQLIQWPHLVRACNDYYLSRLDNDLRTLRLLKPGSAWAAHTAEILDAGLRNDLREGKCMLLRVGKHGGADSNTVDGRQIKIMLNEERRERNGRDEKIRLYVFDFEPRTTWYCGDDLDSPSDLMPHGWIVIGPSDCSWLECMTGHHRRTERMRFAEEAARRRTEEATIAQAVADAEAARKTARAAMTPNQQRIEDFTSFCTGRAAQLIGHKENPNAAIHNKARELAKAAFEGADWTADEKQSVVNAIEEWLPKLVKVDIKDERKKLKISALRGL